MRRYTTSATYSGRRSYSPGVLQYSSPASPVRTRSETGQHNKTGNQSQPKADQHRN
ncbi:hypothetical protein [Spirosoma daeguense]